MSRYTPRIGMFNIDRVQREIWLSLSVISGRDRVCKLNTTITWQINQWYDDQGIGEDTSINQEERQLSSERSGFPPRNGTANSNANDTLNYDCATMATVFLHRILGQIIVAQWVVERSYIKKHSNPGTKYSEYIELHGLKPNLYPLADPSPSDKQPQPLSHKYA